MSKGAMLALFALVSGGTFAGADLARPYTTMNAAAKLVAEGKTASGAFFLDAADAAALTGDGVKCRDFLAYFVAREKGKSREVQRALANLCSAGGSPAYFRRYLADFPKDLDAFAIGLRQLSALARDGKTREYADQLALLIDAWPTGREFEDILQSVHGIVHDNNFLGISDGKQTLKVLTASKKWKYTARVDGFLRQYVRRGLSQPELYELFRARGDLYFPWDLVDNVAKAATTPETGALVLLRHRLEGTGIDPAKHMGWFDSFEKKMSATPGWKELKEDVKAGKYLKGKAGPSRLKANAELAQWGQDWRGGKTFKSRAEAQARAIEILKAHPPEDFSDLGSFNWFIERLTRDACEDKEKKLIETYPFELLAKIVFERPYHNYDNHPWWWLARAYQEAQKLPAAAARIRLAADAADTSVYAATRRLAMGTALGIDRGDLLQNPSYDNNKRILYRGAAGRDRLDWVLEAARRAAKSPLPELAWFHDWTGLNGDIRGRVPDGAKAQKREMTDAEKAYCAQYDELTELLARAVYPYAYNRIPHNWGGRANAEQLLYAAVKKNASAPEIPAYVAATVRLNRSDWRNDLAAAKTLMASNRTELAYLLVSRHRDVDKVSEMQRFRTEAAGKMPGLYPVGEKDPAYPIYVAADAYRGHNPERAWELLSANRKAFDANPLRFPPQFALWALDQYRKVRGRDDELRNAAWGHIEKLLQNETALPADVAAGLFLLRAQIAEDRLDFEIAHAGYQTLRNHATYRTTDAGRQAMFRDVALMITMGNREGADQVADQWIATPEDEIRAAGHYIKARLAFLQKDYDTTRQELEKVFALDFTHAEARLLQGEWKLATNYEVDDTQVLLGDLADRAAIRPGQPLTVSVQDRILAVAGGGASIPILVTTSSGRDRETLPLYPGTRDPSLFRGSIDSVTGVAKPGNGILELAGDDTVTYAIDPDFLARRGLPAGSSKSLTVVDDATLAVGAGAGTDDETVSYNLRPGLPLRLTVQDRDRARADGSATVECPVSTSSGDKLLAVLKETAPCSGVFKGVVETALPPPRAFASDSTAGQGPDDLVSSVRDGAWQSRADGRKPKSVGLDAMTSHDVKSAKLEMHAPETVARLRLWGELFGKETLLGSYPAEKADLGAGIRLVELVSDARNTTDFTRLVTSKLVTPTTAMGWRVHRTAGGNAKMWHHLSASICPSAPVQLKLRAKPLNASGAEHERLRWLSFSVWLDGVRVLAGSGDALRTSTFDILFEAGVHDLEIYATTQRPTDSFELCSVAEDGALLALPADWTDAKAHAAIAAERKPKCTIARGKGCYVATFEKPERLRRLRWEFLDFTGASVSATKLRVTDAAGATVIPSEHDFTEALGNGRLEISPGDHIRVTYSDTVTVSGRSRVLERGLTSTYANGAISFLHEELTDTPDGPVSQLMAVYRVAPGDTLFVRASDPDLDATEDEDEIDVRVRTTGGAELTLRAREHITIDRGMKFGTGGGVFTAFVRTVDPATLKKGEKPPAGTLPLKKGEGVVASFHDAQNTNPGVPVDRETRIAAVPDADCSLRLTHTWSERFEDRSPDAAQKLRTIRRRGESAGATKVWASGAYGAYAAVGESVIVTPETSLLVSLKTPSRVRHAGSFVNCRVICRQDLEEAEAAGETPPWEMRRLTLNGDGSLRIKAPPKRGTPAKGDAPAPAADEVASTAAVLQRKELPDTLTGAIDLYSSAAEERLAARGATGEGPLPLDLIGDDTLIIQCLDDDGSVIAEGRAQIGTSAWMGLVDATYTAENTTVHLGETLHLQVVDPDRDESDELDTITVEAEARSGHRRTLTLMETAARSGVFTTSLTPVVRLETNAVAAAGTTNVAARVPEAGAFLSGYGDEIRFTYADAKTAFYDTPHDLTAYATVLPGSDGDVRAYSKRFRDADQAVLVQFRLAECLFEMAKDFRKLKDAAKSTAAIAEGRGILEAALKDYPHTRHAAEGEFLLANLYEQLAEEEKADRKRREKEGEDLSAAPDKSTPLYREAVARFSSILSAWPEGEYAARSQYHKALCLERLEDFARASEEYVKMTYLFPESPLVGDASVRLASHYYAREKRYDIAGKIYTSFRTRFPAHPQAPNALFMGGQCLVKQAESLLASAQAAAQKAGKAPPKMTPAVHDAYADAVAAFVALTENYKDINQKDLLAQGLYWAGDISFRNGDYANAYIYLKRTTFEYPESKWARHARGLLLQESTSFEGVMQ